MTPIPVYFKGLILFALVDDEDAERVAGIRWTAVESQRIDQGGTMRKTLAVVHVSESGGTRVKTWLARLLTDATDEEKALNLNGNGLDCRRENLGVRGKRR